MPVGLDPEFIDIYKKEILERAGGSLVFTNTHPAKITEVLRYAKTIPGSRFLFVKRDIDDLILKTYMKYYKSGNSYAYCVKTIYEHIEWYHNLIDIYEKKIPGICKIVKYEEMIGDPASTMIAACKLCGIEGDVSTIPSLGDDRGVAEPYAGFIRDALEG